MCTKGASILHQHLREIKAHRLIHASLGRGQLLPELLKVPQTDKSLRWFNLSMVSNDAAQSVCEQCEAGM
jgi:hypothetical protein